MSKEHQIICPVCNRVMVWDEEMRLRFSGNAAPCPQCVDAIAMDLEQGMAELVTMGKAVVVGKTKDGRNLYDLVSA